MPGLYADENFPLPVVEELRRLGFDVLTMYEDDKANQSLTDEAVLSIASDKQRGLLTANRRHFIQLHRRQPHIGLYYHYAGRQAGAARLDLTRVK